MIVAAIVVIYASPGSAQSPATAPATMPGDPLPVPSAPPAVPQWVASVGLGFALTSGNADTSTLNVSFDVSEPSEDAQRVQGRSDSYLRGEENGEVNVNRLSMRARDEYTRAAGRRYVFGQIEGLRDTFKDIDYLVAPSIGLGHKVRDTPALALFLDAGVGLKVEKNMRRALRTVGRRHRQRALRALQLPSTPRSRSRWPRCGRSTLRRRALHLQGGPDRRI